MDLALLGVGGPEMFIMVLEKFCSWSVSVIFLLLIHAYEPWLLNTYKNLKRY